MATKKEIPSTLLTGKDKDILIAFCQGLPESKCRKAYMILRDEFSPDKSKYIRFNELGKRDDSGLVKLKKAQLTRLINRDGEFAVDWKIKRLHKYISYLQAHANEDATTRKRWRKYRDEAHYQVLANGWVHGEYLKEAPTPPAITGRIDFYSITTPEEAIAFINQEGLENLSDSPELEFLTNRFHQVVEYVIEGMKEDKTSGYTRARVEQQ